MGPDAHNTELYLKEFSKSLTDRTYTWYINLKLGAVQDWGHLMSYFNSKFFYAEARLTLAELSCSRQYSGEDLNV